MLALLNGTLDMTDSFLPVDQVERIEKSSNAHVAKNVTMRLLVIRMNNTKPPFDNIDARKAFAHAFNYTGFIDEIVKGNAVRDPVPIPNNIWGFPKDVAGYDFDLKKAKEYFDKAVAEGAPMKRPIQMHVQQPLEQTVQSQPVVPERPYDGRHRPEAGQRHLRQFGQHISSKADTTPDVCGSTGSAPITSTRITGSARCMTAATTAPGRRRAGTLIRGSTICYTKARFTTDQEIRAPMYEQAAKMIVADSPDIWIYNMIEVCGISNRVQGFRHCPVGSGGEVRWMHLSA